ncbi:hypothetical protein MPH_10031 [Macrophomina phaseolina MS6]|uniref:Uncharacterized protein n=1 Tax=Macrophomina phaseolina (strain MS6) TaxID=1126212 RepID=K2RDX3_MACPH|nr:hypothetical protein MPH_10031 [Macrophomina phaseolina MS6]
MSHSSGPSTSHINSASSPNNSGSGSDESDSEVLKPDFLDGIPDHTSSSHDKNEPRSDDDPASSQLKSEASIGTSPENRRKRTDEESAAILNSALSSRGRGPAPLPTRVERRKASHEGRTTASFAASRNGTAAHDLIPDSTPPPISSSAPKQNEEQNRSSGPGVSARAKGQQLDRRQGDSEYIREREEREGRDEDRELPRKRIVRPRKNTEDLERGTKRQKISSANTTRRRSKGGEGDASHGAGPQAEAKSGSACEALSRRRKSRERARVDFSEGDKNEFVAELPTADRTSPSDNEDQEPSGDPSAFSTLQESLRDIWTDPRGVETILRNREYYGLVTKNESSRGLINRCEELGKLLKDLMKNSRELTEVSEAKAQKSIIELQKEIVEFSLVRKKEIKNHLFQDLYASILPSLLRTLRKMVEFYIRFFSQDARQAIIPTTQLVAILDFTSAIIELEKRARSSEITIDSSLKIVKPTRNYIIAPLKKFHKQLQQMHQQQVAREERDKASLVEQRRLERCKIKRQQEAKEESLRRAYNEDWRQLHIIRKQMEPDFSLWKYFDYIAPPSTHQQVSKDVDANGQPFHRWDIFNHRRTHHRRGSAELVQELSGTEWTDEQRLALMESLSEYAEKDFSMPVQQS